MKNGRAKRKHKRQRKVRFDHKEDFKSVHLDQWQQNAFDESRWFEERFLGCLVQVMIQSFVLGDVRTHSRQQNQIVEAVEPRSNRSMREIHKKVERRGKEKER